MSSSSSAVVALLVLMTGALGVEPAPPWTTSKLAGRPDPPLPFTTANAFPGLAWDRLIYALAEPGDGGNLLVIEEGNDSDKPARIHRVLYGDEEAEKQPVLELPGWLVYALSFDPQHAANGFVYLFQKGRPPALKGEKGVRISRFHAAGGRIDPESELPILEWRSEGHDGGDLAFGRDGMLYITTGDGSGDSDDWVSGQTLDDLLGAVLRIDVRGASAEEPYRVPPDNPFVDAPGARPEIWAYGLRNPWRMSADPGSDRIWVGNNGQDLWETVHLLGRGENYGWSVFEGSHPFYANRRLGPTPHVPPTVEHPHSEARSLTGGIVCRGDKWPELDGVYVYGDYSTGKIWGALHDGEELLWVRELADTTLQIAGFALAPGGDVLIVDHANAIHRLVRNPPPDPNAPPFPHKLSATGLFRSLPDLVPENGVIAYEINAPGWHDGAQADRWMAVPEPAKVVYKDAAPWDFPAGTALVQTLSLPRSGQDGGVRRIETRILLRQQNEWQGYSYRWNAAGTDAGLVSAGGADVQFEAEGATRDWRVPSRAECAMCHNRAALYVLGINGRQLNRMDPAGGINQLRALHGRGLFSNAPPEKLPDPMPDPHGDQSDLEARARSYLHVNCSICHVEAGGGNARLDLRQGTARDRMMVFDARPQHATFGLEDAAIVAPGAPQRSVLLHRVSRRGRGSGQMPPLATAAVDEAAVKMLREWIASMEPTRATVQDWTMDDFTAELENFDERGHDYLGGRTAFTGTGCIQCHRFGGEGGSVGPELAGLGSKQGAGELLESILEPSRHIAEHYAVPGTDPPVSLMPRGMVNVLEKPEVLDLVYFLKRDGRPRVAAVVTEYRHNSHADIIVSRLLQTDTLDGQGRTPPLELASLYTDQVPDSDTSRALSAEHGFPIHDSIADALTLGTGKLAVDGVLLIAEHGDYPKSDTGNTRYPKRRFWNEILAVFDASGRVVPVFVDKHLADNWADAKFIFDSAVERGIPLMAGSSLPVTWRRPAADVPRGAQLREIVALTFHTTDAYGFHALEIVQALAEQRAGGETGIAAVQSLAGEAVWRAFEDGRFDRALFDAAWSRLSHPGDAGKLRDRVPAPRLLSIDYSDGLKAHLLELNGAVGEWSAAWRYADGKQDASLFWTQEGRPGMHFTWLLGGIEEMILTGEPAWNAERTLHTSGALDALLISLKDGGRRVETPYLDIPYQPSWRWTEPPPPPPTRPWSGQ